MVTDYLQKTSGTCRYSYSKLKDVLYLVSYEHLKDVQIDNGEAYISGLTELPLRINGFNIQFNEETSLDERYKFQKTLTLSMHGYVNYKIFGGRYYAIIEDIEGTFYMINVDFPSRITHTFNLSKDTYQTDFTFASLSNFPTLKLNAEFEAVSPVCLGLNVYGIDKLQLIEKEKARLDTINKAVISTEDFKTVEFLGNSCSFQEVYDGFKVTDTITFNIALDNYKPSWQYNLLEFLDNRYAAIITPRGNDNKFYPGFNFGLQPSYTIQTASQQGESDIITITLTEASSYGTTAAVDWDEDQSTQTRWRWVKRVGEIICFECIGLGLARYLVRQEVDIFGNPTGNYQVMEGYESQYPNFHIVGTFTTQEIFETSECSEDESCQIETTIPNTVYFNAITCNTYTLKTSCDWQFTNVPSNITVEPMTGAANSSYTVSICNTLAPSATALENNMLLKCCKKNKVVNFKTQLDSGCIKPQRQYINCLSQDVVFTYDGSCRIQITSIDPRLTYAIGNNTLTVRIPRNYSTSAIVWSIIAINCDCSSGSTIAYINQDKTYERWVVQDGFICEDGNSYKVERKYTGATQDNINVPTSETRKGDLIQSGDTRCGAGITKWEWDGESYYCVDGNKFKAIFEWISYDGGMNWVKTGNTRLGDMVEADSEWCNLPVTYSWVLTTKWVCGYESPAPPTPTPEYRTVSTGYTCIGYDKYTLNEYQVSYDEGETWETVSSTTGSLIEADSEDCGYVPPTPEYRTVSTAFTCVGYDKHYLDEYQVSYDSGTTWETISSSTGSLIEANSEYCGYVPPVTAFKFNATYNDSQTYSAECDSSTTLTTVVTRPSGYEVSAMTDAEIGSCISTLNASVFSGCTSLSSITIPDSVTSIGNSAFNNCFSLTSINIPSGVTTISSSSFYNCRSLTSIDIPSGVTSIGNYAFQNCSGLTSIDIPSGVTSIGTYAFTNCSGLQSIDIPDSVTSIGNSAFTNCSGLTSIDISSGITSINSNVFRGCTNLTSIGIPSGVTSIGVGAFFDCSSLSNITFEQGSQLTSIGINSFNKCSNITSIDIPDSVTSIGDYAFYDCSGLTSITINKTTPPTLGTGVFYNTNDCPIYVPAESVETYKAASGWSDYANRITNI